MASEIHKQITRLDDLFNKVSKIEDIELQAHWARYLCILVAGFIEVSVRTIFINYVSQRSSPEVTSYVNSKLKRITNLTMEKIINLSFQFKTAWGEEIKRKTNGELKDAIDSIVANRNNIAHGQDTGISFHRIKNWYEKAKDVIIIINDVLKNY